MVKHEHLAIIYTDLFPNLVPNIDWLVQNNFDGQGAFLVSWNNAEAQPEQAEVDAAEADALANHNVELLRVIADDELIARSTGKVKSNKKEVSDQLPVPDQNDRAAVDIKIADGTYDTELKVRDAQEWRKGKPT